MIDAEFSTGQLIDPEIAQAQSADISRALGLEMFAKAVTSDSLGLEKFASAISPDSLGLGKLASAIVPEAIGIKFPQPLAKASGLDKLATAITPQSLGIDFGSEGIDALQRASGIDNVSRSLVGALGLAADSGAFDAALKGIRHDQAEVDHLLERFTTPDFPELADVVPAHLPILPAPARAEQLTEMLELQRAQLELMAHENDALVALHQDQVEAQKVMVKTLKATITGAGIALVAAAAAVATVIVGG